MRIPKQHALVIIAFMITSLSIAIAKDLPMYLCFLVSSVFTYSYIHIAKCDKAGLFEHVLSGLRQIQPVIVILGSIGMMIALWMQMGTLSACISLGLNILPKFNIVLAAFLLTAVISMLLGTAVGTIGTIGIMLIALAKTLDVPLALMTGAIVSGSYLGDRTSPLSSSANLIANVANVKISQHIAFILRTSILPVIIAACYYFFKGSIYMPNSVTHHAIDQTIFILKQHFATTIYHFFPVFVLLFIIIVFKKGIIPAIYGAIAMSLLIGFLTGISFFEMIEAMLFGYTPQLSEIGNVFKGSGLISMIPVFLVLFFASILNSLFDHIALFDVFFNNFDKYLHTKKALIFGSGFVSLIIMVLTGNQSLPAIVAGNRYLKQFENKNINSKWLAASISDYMIILVAMIPWNINAILVKSIVSVKATDYIPYAILPLVMPVTSFLFTVCNKELKG